MHRICNTVTKKYKKVKVKHSCNFFLMMDNEKGQCIKELLFMKYSCLVSNNHRNIINMKKKSTAEKEKLYLLPSELYYKAIFLIIRDTDVEGVALMRICKVDIDFGMPKVPFKQ